MPHPTATPILKRSPAELQLRFRTIASIDDVADLLEITTPHLTHVLYGRRDRYQYRSFEIPKRSGEKRKIQAPPASIAILQRKLSNVLYLVYRPRQCVHGFVRGRSIVTNAQAHAGKRFVLNVDLLDFFPSINFGRVRGMFMAKPWDLPAAPASVLAQLCCSDGTLPQGAPTSPVVSNLICARLDSELQRLAKEFRCTYTRYADDLTFSTTSRRFPSPIATTSIEWPSGGAAIGTRLSAVITNNGFNANERKTRLQMQGHRQIVTGLVVNRFPNTNRRYVRQVRAMIHALQRYGAAAAANVFAAQYDPKKRPADKKLFEKVVAGKLELIRMTKGDGDLTYRRLSTKLHSTHPHLARFYATDERRDDSYEIEDQTWQSIFAKLSVLVYQIEIVQGDSISSGTAFALRDVLVTAAHNLKGSVSISSDVGEFSIVSHEPHSRSQDGVDVALIRVDPLPRVVQKTSFSVRSEPLQPGEQVAAIAIPRTPLRMPTRGIFTGYVEALSSDYRGDVNTIQTSIQLSGGMSGGPVVDRSGMLVGVVSETTFEKTVDGIPARSFFYFLPIAYVLEMIERSPKTAQLVPKE